MLGHHAFGNKIIINEKHKISDATILGVDIRTLLSVDISPSRPCGICFFIFKLPQSWLSRLDIGDERNDRDS